MRVLLDTHTFLWMGASPERLGERARETFVAQALVGAMPIVSRDEALDAYGVQRIW